MPAGCDASQTAMYVVPEMLTKHSSCGLDSGSCWYGTNCDPFHEKSEKKPELSVVPISDWPLSTVNLNLRGLCGTHGQSSRQLLAKPTP